MNETVLDASIVLKWFAREAEPGVPSARSIRAEYEAGRLSIVVPSLLFLEILNVAGRRWGRVEPELLELSADLELLMFDIQEPDLASVAMWVARGLTAYDAAYVALAEERGVPLISDDAEILSVATEVARPLTSV